MTIKYIDINATRVLCVVQGEVGCGHSVKAQVANLISAFSPVRYFTSFDDAAETKLE